jgi:hypothetical protein
LAWPRASSLGEEIHVRLFVLIGIAAAVEPAIRACLSSSSLPAPILTSSMQQMECNQDTGLPGRIVKKSRSWNQPNPEGYESH